MIVRAAGESELVSEVGLLGGTTNRLYGFLLVGLSG